MGASAPKMALMRAHPRRDADGVLRHVSFVCVCALEDPVFVVQARTHWHDFPTPRYVLPLQEPGNGGGGYSSTVCLGRVGLGKLCAHAVRAHGQAAGAWRET